MRIAWEYLESIHKAQLLKFRPDLESRNGYQCKRCGGQVLRNFDEFSCLQCSAEHDATGQLVNNRLGIFKETLRDGRAGDQYKGGVPRKVIYRPSFKR